MLCDVLTIIGSRECRKFFPPILAFMSVWNRIEVTEIKHKIDFYSAGAFFVYNIMTEFNYSLNGQKDQSDKIRQALFHGMWGTHCEDFGVLGKITMMDNWFQRHNMMSAYERRTNDSLIKVKIEKLIKYRFVSKLMGGNIGKSGTVPQYSIQLVFHEDRKRRFNEAFKEILKDEVQDVRIGANM